MFLLNVISVELLFKKLCAQYTTSQPDNITTGRYRSLHWIL